MINLLKKLEQKFENHIIRYGKIAEDNLDVPIEVRVRDGGYWSMSYIEGEHSKNVDAVDALIDVLKEQIEREKDKKTR